MVVIVVPLVVIVVISLTVSLVIGTLPVEWALSPSVISTMLPARPHIDPLLPFCLIFTASAVTVAAVASSLFSTLSSVFCIIHWSFPQLIPFIPVCESFLVCHELDYLLGRVFEDVLAATDIFILPSTGEGLKKDLLDLPLGQRVLNTM